MDNYLHYKLRKFTYIQNVETPFQPKRNILDTRVCRRRWESFMEQIKCMLDTFSLAAAIWIFQNEKKQRREKKMPETSFMTSFSFDGFENDQKTIETMRKHHFNVKWELPNKIIKTF